jgi:hypothetical protein
LPANVLRRAGAPNSSKLAPVHGKPLPFTD